MFRSSRPDYIETQQTFLPDQHAFPQLFRSSRPDYIETLTAAGHDQLIVTLFRSSRPDYIETRLSCGVAGG